MRFSLQLVLTVILGVGLGGFLFAFLLAGEIYDYQDSVDGAHLPAVDAIVCLAGGRGRIAFAGDVWYRYWEQRKINPAAGSLPILYLSGMGHQSHWALLTRQVRSGVKQVLQSDHVLIEKESKNTEENAQWVARIAQQKNWQRVLLITSRYHMRRAKLVFDHVLANMNPPLKVETLSVYQEPFEPGEWRVNIHGIRVTVTEYLKWIHYRYFHL